jgi:hypothetical protein
LDCITLDVGRSLHIVFSLGDECIGASAVVVTKFPNIGNGIDFIDMEPNDRMKLHYFIAASSEGAGSPP